jgi:hypothetical protein
VFTPLIFNVHHPYRLVYIAELDFTTREIEEWSQRTAYMLASLSSGINHLLCLVLGAELDTLIDNIVSSHGDTSIMSTLLRADIHHTCLFMFTTETPLSTLHIIDL